MEENKVTRDSSGESDSSEWAVIDEDTSLEWNDEAKYNFRHSNRNTVLGPSVKEVGLGIGLCPESGCDSEVSDGDSIEVVSDDANDDHLSTKCHWVRPRRTKKDVENVELVKQEVLNTETFESQDSEVQTDMVWYPVREKNGPKNDEKSLSVHETKTSSATIASQLSTSFALLAFLFAVGLSLGYSCRSQETVQLSTGPGGSHTTLNNQIMVSKLYRENKLLRYKLRTINSRLGVLPSSTSSLNTSMANLNTSMGTYSNLHQSSNHLKEVQDSRFSSTNCFTYYHQKMSGFVNGNTQYMGKIKNQNTCVNNSDKYKIEDTSEASENVTFEEILGKKHRKILESSTETNVHIKLNSTIRKVDSLLRLHGRVQIDTERALSLSSELMKRMNQNLQVLDSIQVENRSPGFETKMSKFSLSVNKLSRKLVSEIDKSVLKLAVDIQRKVEELQSCMFKKLCNLNVLDQENIPLFKWPNKTVFAECNSKKYKSGIAQHSVKKSDALLQSNKKGNKLKITGKRTYSNGKQAETTRNGKIVNELGEKVKRFKPKDAKSKAKNKHLLKSDVEKRREEIKRNKRISNLELNWNNLQNSADEKLQNSEEWLNKPTEHKINNISGEWVMKIGKGREEQRNYEHQSDWLFDRAESRKIYRDKKGLSRQNMQHPGSHTEGKATFKDQAKKYWKNKKQMLKKMIPKTIVGAAESMKNVFKNFQGQKQMHTRQR